MICIFHTYIWEGSKKKKSTSSKFIVAKGKSSTVIFGWFQQQEKQSPTNIVQTTKKTYIEKFPSTACKFKNVLTMQNGAHRKKQDRK